eukprot:gene31325-40700_t
MIPLKAYLPSTPSKLSGLLQCYSTRPHIHRRYVRNGRRTFPALSSTSYYGSSMSTVVNRISTNWKNESNDISRKIGKVSPANHAYGELLVADETNPGPGPQSRIKISTIDSKEKARVVLHNMMNAGRDTVFACDTEVADIDLKTQGPVGNGKVICISVYAGEDFDFGFGKGHALWAEGVLAEFKEWFENPNYKKVWHNYGFDRHCAGFAGDTMHMARLLDTSRDKAAHSTGAGYSLESLSISFIDSDHHGSKESNNVHESQYKKTSMKDLFGVAKKKKDGEDSKIKEIPDVIELQRNPDTRKMWIEYSAKDAMATWHVHSNLRRCFAMSIGSGESIHVAIPYTHMSMSTAITSSCAPRLEKKAWVVDGKRMGHLFDFYEQYMAPFGELLTEMEKNGIKVDKDGLLKKAEESARAEKIRMEEYFFNWLGKQNLTDDPADLARLNFGSTQQLQQLFFGHFENHERVSGERVLKLERSPEEVELEKQQMEKENPYTFLSSEQLKEKLRGKNLKLAGKKIEDEEESQGGQKERKGSIYAAALAAGLDGGQGAAPSAEPDNEVSYQPLTVLPTEAAFFGGGRAGEEACRAIGALAMVGQIDTTITNFLIPLQALADKDSRVHCSLNLNTETGRLSARRPNLQNQPALEKDQYKIRDAFVAEQGKTFIVADYGQLDMISAFRAGGCFHSRTAVGMYPHIKQAVESGQVLLDTYASERRKAKTLNFSIAYGKTVHGLAQDWGITKQEAEEVLNAWYRDRPEVLEWQKKTQKMAQIEGHRHLPNAKAEGPERSQAMRAAINTPIQGSAADVVMLGMLRLWRSEVLKRLGWKLLLQIHDEVILEGPKESRDEAMAEVRDCMENPFVGSCMNELLVHLDVDAKSADSWYKAK